MDSSNVMFQMVTEYCEIGSLDRMLKLELKEPAISFIIGQVSVFLFSFQFFKIIFSRYF
jgi:hypothetical protein